MAEDLPNNQAFKELGVAGDYVKTGFEYDEFMPELRGDKAIKKYREMRSNDPTIGAFLTAMQMMMRSVKHRIEPADESEQASQYAEFVEENFESMETTFPDFMSNVLTFLDFGFSFFEQIYERRDDGRIFIKDLAPRAQWTLYEFTPDEDGKPIYFHQQTAEGVDVKIPLEKGLLFRTSSVNDNPRGESVLRRVYTSYHYASNIKNIEAIAIERELNGLPVGFIPSEYLTASNEDEPEKAQVLASYKKMLRDVKFNDQGYMLLPSDPYVDEDGKYTNMKMVDFKLVASEGTRAIDTSGVINRYQQDIARAVLADFLMLGSGAGSFALSKSKADLFLKALEGYLDMIAAVLNRRLIPTIWKLNGFDKAMMPKLVFEDVAPMDLQELGDYIRSLGGVGLQFMDEETENVLRQNASLPDRPEDDDILGRPDGGIDLPTARQPEPGDTNPDDDVHRVASKEGLNGAQIRSVIDVVAEVSSGRLTRDAARELIMAVGISESSVDRILNNVRQVAQPSESSGSDS